jgi:hypothetical protein
MHACALDGGVCIVRGGRFVSVGRVLDKNSRMPRGVRGVVGVGVNRNAIEGELRGGCRNTWGAVCGRWCVLWCVECRSTRRVGW